MRLEPSERETIILFSDADDTASVYTFDKKLKARLMRPSIFAARRIFAVTACLSVTLWR